MVFKKKKVKEPVVEEEEEEEDEEEEVEVPEIEPAPGFKGKKPLKEKTVVVYDFPQRQVTQEVVDGELIKYITVAQALTKFINEEE